ncbi:MAG: hypothetical protein Q4A32_05915, partial [Lachnospiraceae bacterium]|nr:hypothetical protein [Lachnospiraceae bacterium]
MITSIKTQAVQLGSSYRLPIHILYRSIPGRLGGDVSFADAIIAKYKSANEQELPSADFVYPKYGERDAGDALTELSRQLILMNRIRIQMNIRNYRIMQRYSLTVSARCDQLLNMLRMQTNAYSGVSQESVRELMQIHRELKERINESASRDSLVQMHAGVSNVREDEESTLIMKILTAASRGNGTRERYMRRLIDRMHSIGAAESRNSYESASRALLQKAETELFRLPERENGTSMTLWNSDAARQFFWRIQRTPEPLRSVFLDAGGFSSLVTFEKVLKGMDTEAFRAFAEPLIERISYSLSRPVPAAGTAAADGEYGDGEWLRLYHAAENAAAVLEAGADGSDGRHGADGALGSVGLRGADGAFGLAGLRGADGASGQESLIGADGLADDAFRFFDRLSDEEWNLFRSEMIYADQGGQLKEQLPELYRVLAEGRNIESTDGTEQSGTDRLTRDRAGGTLQGGADGTLQGDAGAGEPVETERLLLSSAKEGVGTEEYSQAARVHVEFGRSASRAAVENILKTMDRETFQTVVFPLMQRISGSVPKFRFSREREAAGESEAADLRSRYTTVEQTFASLAGQALGRTDYAEHLFERQSEEVWETFCLELIHADSEGTLRRQTPELYRELVKAQNLTAIESSLDISINNTESLSSRAAFENVFTTMDRETFRTVVYPLLQRMTENVPEYRVLEEGMPSPEKYEDGDQLVKYHAVERVFASLADRTGKLEGEQGAEGQAGRSGQQGVEGYAGRSGLQGIEGYGGHERYYESEDYVGWEALRESAGSDGSEGMQGSTGFGGREGLQGLAGSNGREGLQGLAGSDGFEGLQGLTGTEGRDGLSGAEYFDVQLLQENLSDYTDHLIERQSEEVWELFCTEMIYADREGQLKNHVPELYQALIAGQNPTADASVRLGASSLPHTVEKKDESADSVTMGLITGTEALPSRKVVENIFTTMDQETFYHVVRPLMQKIVGGVSISEELEALIGESEAADQFIRYDTAERVFAALANRTFDQSGAEGHAGQEGL